MFNSFIPQVVFQEVPNHVSLAFTVTGCPLRCSGCHSQDTWSRTAGLPLSDSLFTQYLEQYATYISCVLFFGGEWRSSELINKLKIAHRYQMKTCLYTGLDKIPQRIIQHLDFLKTGPWLQESGGLDKPTSNQQFVDLASGQTLNTLFLSHPIAAQTS